MDLWFRSKKVEKCGSATMYMESLFPFGGNA